MNGQCKQEKSCREIRESFLDLLDGDIDLATSEKLSMHLKACKDCSRHWEAYKYTVNALRSLESVDVPTEMMEKIRKRLYRQSKWDRLLNWISWGPNRSRFAGAFAACVVVLLVASIWMWSSNTRRPHKDAGHHVVSKPLPSRLLDLANVHSSVTPSTGPLLPTIEDLMKAANLMEEERERNLMSKAVLQEDLVLDIAGSEEVFSRIQAIMEGVKGKMFIMGIRNRRTGKVIKSRIVMEVPLEHYYQVLDEIQSLGHVYRLYLDREGVPTLPDRLRIRVLAVRSFGPANLPPLKRSITN